MTRIMGTYSVEGYHIEYTIVGKGDPILVMHGGHSNCNEVFGYESLINSGFMIITPSRAGYGKTSRNIGESLGKACNYYVKLLDHLGIEKVHVLSISAGGPSGLYFASHYPERIKTLTLQSAVTKEWHTSKDKIYKLAQILFHPNSEKMTWKLIAFMSNLFPKFLFKQMLSSFSTLSYKEIKDKMSEEDINEVRMMNNRQQSGAGFLIDLSQTKEITSEDLKAITSKTLIMHSKHDGAVSLEHAQYAHRFIAGSQLDILEAWGHLIWLGKESKDMHERLVDFLK